jgi:hypothetical protein
MVSGDTTQMRLRPDRDMLATIRQNEKHLNQMKTKSILSLASASLVAIALCGAPSPVSAQTTNKPTSKKPATETQETAKSEKKPSAGPFHGKLAAVDQTAKTISVGKRTFLITAETKIKKDGKPALLKDGVVGEEVSGYVKPNDAGKLVATTVNFGPKSTANTSEKKPDSSAKEAK